MIEQTIVELISKNGFAAAIALILLYDKIKTNGALRQVVINNNELLREIKKDLKGAAKKR